MLIVPYGAARSEFRVSNSRFLAAIAPADSVAQARAFIAGIRGEFPDATHCVPAFLIGGGNSVTEFCSDDGEPSGTAGRPLLAVLKGSGLGNAAIAVLRWFGGTQLGTGGLVKAYSEAGRLAVAAVRRAALVPGLRARVVLPYHLFDRARLALAACGATVLREDFAESVCLELEFPAEVREELARRLADLGSGTLDLETIGETVIRTPLDGGGNA